MGEEKLNDIKSKLKKVFKKEYLLLLFFVFVILSFLVIEPIENLDEIWNYNTARAISEGLIPYKEISMITTPLLPMINALILSIFGNEVLVMRIIAALLCSSILLLTFNIFRKIFKETNINLICTSILFLLCNEYSCIDYNFFVLFLVLVIINLELKLLNISYEKNNEEKEQNWNIDLVKNLYENKKLNVLIGLLAGFSICTKQSVGAIVSVFVLIYPLLFLRKREDIKKILICILNRFIGICIPLVIFLVYLILTGSLFDFIDYGVIGITYFDNKIEYKVLFENPNLDISIFAKIFPIALIFLLIFNIFSKKYKIKNRILLLLLTYSIPMLILMYPISDAIHFVIGTYIFKVTLLYLIVGIFGRWIYGKIKINKKKRIYKIVSLIAFLLIYANITSESIHNYFYYFNEDKNHNIRHYANIVIEDYLFQRINEIDQFILEMKEQGKNVYILDSEAAVYNIPLDIYNKDYDMFLKGNIGGYGEGGLINKIQKQAESKDNLFLVRNEKSSQNWQTPLNVVEYVKNNFEKIDQVSFYDVYVRTNNEN